WFRSWPSRLCPFKPVCVRSQVGFWFTRAFLACERGSREFIMPRTSIAPRREQTDTASLRTQTGTDFGHKLKTRNDGSGPGPLVCVRSNPFVSVAESVSGLQESSSLVREVRANSLCREPP